jgi:hypothetical protein
MKAFKEDIRARALSQGKSAFRLIAWGDALVDGHNRHKICERLGVPYEVRQMDFADRDDALIWIIRNRFNRRTLPRCSEWSWLSSWSRC